ncbi:hypothetical protein [Actinomadura roseirufa]|uniref:hypothetical protein n=1 Tax=Actinomadura roseirufa TaxID=2094049 RepID=UPI0013F16AE9|nr:hypothetical protein [Actinomadura roseirufa]
MRERRILSVHLHLDGTVVATAATAAVLPYQGVDIEHAEALVSLAVLAAGLLTRRDADH